MTKIRDWTMTRKGEQTVWLEKDGRGPVIIDHEAGMDEDALTEVATSRAFEAELRDAGATDVNVTREGEFVGNPGKASKKLQQEYADHITESRMQQEMRSRRRLRAERS